MGFIQTNHEKCLYSKTLEDGSTMYILRQVDDVAIAAKDKTTAEHTIKTIGSCMKSPIKHEGLTEIFNGVNVDQKRDYIKVHCKTYLERVMKRHAHWIDDIPPSNEPHPMVSDNKYAETIENDCSTTIEEIRQLEEEFKFKY